MKKVITQEEEVIDELIRAAGAGAAVVALVGHAPVVIPWDRRLADQVGTDARRVLEILSSSR